MKGIYKLSVVSLLVALGAAGGVKTFSSSPVVETKAEGLSYIDKELNYYGLQVNNVSTAQNRFQLAFCVPASVDHPETAELRGAYYTNGDGKQLNSITECPSDFTYSDCLNRIKALNFVQGNIEVDDNPMLYRTDTNRDVYRLHDTVQGRVILTKNADSTTDSSLMRLKVQLDVNIPNYATGIHVVTLKAGTELPSWSYALGATVGSTTANTVYRTLKTMKWAITWSGSAFTIAAKSYTNVEPECVGTIGWNTQSASDRVKMSKTWQVATGRVGFSWDAICGYSRYTTNGYNTLSEPQIHYYNTTDYISHGNATQLNVWEKILVNGEAVSKYYNDDRFRENGASGVEDGASYGRMWCDFKTANLGTDPLTITIKKGFQVPTPETVTDTTKATYLTTDRDWTFTYTYNSEFSWTCSSIVAGEDPVYNTVNTSVTGVEFKLATTNHSFCYAAFKLEGHDNTTVNTCYNNKSIYWSGAYNAFDKIYVDGDPAKTIYSQYGDASGRSYRVCMYNGAPGFPIGFSELEVPCTSITIPAGTRFPAGSVFEGSKNSDALPVATANQVYYVTTADVTLVQRNGAWITEAAAAIVDEADGYADSFLAAVTCDNGVTAPSVEAWNSMATAFIALSSEAKSKLVFADSNSSDKVKAAVARYDYIIAKYGATTYDNFMARTISSAPTVRSVTQDTTAVTAAVAVISVISLTAVVGFTLAKKRKEN